jgi:hypothetical protein
MARQELPERKVRKEFKAIPVRPVQPARKARLELPRPLMLALLQPAPLDQTLR